jgi:hypothetical protein
VRDATIASLGAKRDEDRSAAVSGPNVTVTPWLTRAAAGGDRDDHEDD